MSRDDQFAGFASRLLQELLDQCAYVAISEWATGGDSFKSEQLIARRAYDFACHITEQVSEGNAAAIEVRFKTPQEVVSDMRDMTAWPEETSK